MEKLLNQLLQFPPDNDRFLQETFDLEDTDFVREVFNTYLKRWLQPKDVTEVEKILREGFKSRLKFLVEFICPSLEFQELCQWWASTSEDDIYWRMGKLLAQQGRRNEAIAAYRQALKPKFDSVFADEDSEKPVILPAIDSFPPEDEEFLELTANLSDADFIQAVYREYFKRNLDNQGVNHLLKIFYESFPQRSEFIAKFIRPSQEFQELCQFFATASKLEIQGRLIALWAENGEWERVIASSHQIILLEPDFVRGYSRCADRLKREGRSDIKISAIAKFLTYLLLKPFSKETYKSLGQFLAQVNLENQTPAVNLSNLKERVLGKALVLVELQGLNSALSYLREESVNLKKPNIWEYYEVYPEMLTFLGHILQTEGKLSEASVCFQNAAPGLSPIGSYNSTKKYIATSKLKGAEYIEIYPSHEVEITTSPKTLDIEVHPILTSFRKLKYPGAFVAKIPKGRFCQTYRNRHAAITSNNYLLQDISSNFQFKNTEKHLFLSQELPSIEKLSGIIVVFQVNPGKNFCHTLLDFIPTIGMLETTGIDFNNVDKFLLTDYGLSYQSELLRLCGISDDKTVNLLKHPHVQADELVIVSSYVTNYDTKFACDFLRHKLLPLAKTSEVNGTNRIYISRSRATHRKIINEDEVIGALEELGFVTIVTELISIKEQVALFSQAEVVVSIHGAGLANIAFCKPGTKVIEILTPNFLYIPRYYILSHCCELEYYYLIAEAIKNSYLRSIFYDNHNGREDVLVNINSLKALLKMAEID